MAAGGDGKPHAADSGSGAGLWQDVYKRQAQYTLDGAYGSINGKTIHFSEGSYADVLVLARPTKYAGSGTNYFKPVSGGFEKQEITDLMNTGCLLYTSRCV